MKQKKKGIMFMLLFGMLLLAFGMTANAGFKRMPNGKYRYYTSKTKYYHGKTTGKTQDRWTFKNIKNSKTGKTCTYCFDTNGYMLTGWQRLYTTTKSGRTGWSCYYFNKNGRMYKNVSKGDYYFLGNGRLASHYAPNGKYYSYDGLETGAPADGGKFVTTKKGTKYQLADGSYVTKSWKCIRESEGSKYYWYYFYSTGYMAKNCWVGNHYVDKYGHLVSNATKS